MRRPPLWTWALPACVALGVLLGVRLRGAPAAAPVNADPDRADSGAVARPALPAPVHRDTSAGSDAVPVVADSADWGWDGGGYGPLSGSPTADTLPAPPVELVHAGEEEDREAEPAADTPVVAPETSAPARPSGPGPAQALSLADGIARLLVGAVRADGRLSFYAAWDAPSARASLVGEWASPGRCAGAVRLDYEQPASGLGAVRGVGTAERTPPWSVALLVPRQHCAAASGKWSEPRPPRGDEVAMLASLAGGERASAVVIDGDEAWVAWPGRAARARIRGGRAVEVWSAVPADGSSIRLLGVWDGDGVWVATGAGGRVLQVWRVRARQPGEG